MPFIRDHLKRYTSAPLLMYVVDLIAVVLMIAGAVHWGLLGALNVDLIAALFGQMTAGSRVIYLLVGVAGISGVSLLVWLPPPLLRK